MKRAKMAFSGMVQEGRKKPAQVVYEKGDLVLDADPAVAAFPEMFEDADE